MTVPFQSQPIGRRPLLRSLASASMLLPGMLSELMADPARPGHFPAKAKRVIFLYMSGGVSHVDTFDYKPKLVADHGKLFKKDYLSAPRWKFSPNAKNGVLVSDLFPHMRTIMDEVCLINSMKNDHNNHAQAVMGLHGGSVMFARPSIGSWISYGLGSMNQNLPAFVVLAPEMPYTGSLVWDSVFLPASHQGTHVTPGGEPIPNMTRRDPADVQGMKLGFAELFNKRHLAERDGDSYLAARVKSFETAFGMQNEAPEAFDVSKESDETLKLYGLERGSTKGFAWQCLVARRLAERGVRFIELIDIGSLQLKNWDAHADMKTHIPLALNVDQAITGLIRDLKGRGMLDETLVVWTSEFGRKPGDALPGELGRGHHANAYSSWLAGGGIKPGIVYGQSDDYGYDVAKDMCHIHDFHATILNRLGLDHTKLTFRHDGRDFRLTDVAGRVIKEILV